MKQIEIKEKRKKREKHFLQENGEIIAEVYDEDIHYLKNGKYEEIDNTLVKNYGSYVNKNNKFKLSFDTSSANIMTLKYEDKQIKIKLKNCNEVEPTNINNENKLHSSIEYKNIVDNIDLRYKLFPNKLKEDIILKTKDSLQQELVFEIETDFKIRMQDSNTITFYKNNKSIFSIDAPYMMDSNGVYNDNIYYNLKELNDKYELKLIVDTNWLNSEDIKYPVIIDPTITNIGENNSVYDTYIYPGDTNDTRYNKDVLKVGIEKVNGKNRINRALLKFTLPTIGTGSQITNARLMLYGYPIENGSDDRKDITIHQITSNWTESGANWNNMNNKYNSRVENHFKSWRSTLNFNNTVSLRISECIITNIVKKWYADTPNYGIMLKLNEEVYTTNVLPEFFSKNNTVTGGNPKPILLITYRNQNGLENYMKYYNQSLSHGTIYENLYNGNLTTIFDVGSTISGNKSTNLNIVYNTNDVILNNDWGYGLGYKFNMHRTIKKVTIDNINYLEYIDEDGTIHYLKESNNKYYDEDGLGFIAEKLNNNYIITDKSKTKMKFQIVNSIGYLSEIADASGDTITITYENNKITKIKDANNSEINIIYENNQIIINNSAETIYLNYIDNCLTNITRTTGITQFTYNENNIVSNIQDEDGIKYCFEYYEYSPYRIKTIAEYGIENSIGNTLQFSYGFNTTKVKNEQNRVEMITFNSYGNVASIINLDKDEILKSAYGQKRLYGEVLQEKNKLRVSCIPEQVVKNYLLNTSFEDDKIYFTGEGILATISDDTSYSGDKSLKIINNNANSEIKYTINLTKNKYYTFSGYIKSTSKVKIALSYLDQNNDIIVSESDVINANDSFEREDVTIFYPETAMSDVIVKLILLTPGTTYLDNIQLEEGEVANNYNYVENCDFSNGLTGWTTVAFDAYSDQYKELPTNDKFEVVNIENDLKALKIIMNPKYTTRLERTFKINGKAGDIFNINFWYKNEGVKEELLSYNNYAYLHFNYIDENLNGRGIITENLNSDCNDWQYYNAIIKAEGDFTEITLRFAQLTNANQMYITNIGVYKDLAFINCIYDDEGNMTSLKKLNNTNDNFNYDNNNQLIKVSTGENEDFSFEYDNIVSTRVLRGISENGLCNENIYDDNGNKVVSKTTYYSPSLDGGGFYRIRLKGGKKYLKNINNSIKVEEERGSHNKWIIEKIDDNYRIKHYIIQDKVITCKEDKIILSDILDDNSLFSFVKNDNGSYLIKKKSEDKYLNYNNILKLSSLEENNPNFEFIIESDTEQKFIENNIEYTSDGKFVKKVIDSNLNETNYEIEESTGLLKSIENVNNITTYYEYNNKNQLISIKCKDKKITISYNDQNLLNKLTFGDKEYKFEYDEFLNTKIIKIGDNIKLITNIFDKNNGNIKSVKYGNNHEIHYTYDEFERIKTLTKMDNIYNYKYGNNGDLLKIISDDEIIKFIYDLAKRISEYRNNHFKIKYTYDNNDNILEKLFVLDNIKNVVTNNYSKDHMLTEINFDNYKIYYDYDFLGRIKRKSINNVFNINYNYISTGNRVSLLIKSITDNYNQYMYKYDKLNNITHIYKNNNLIKKYYYDEYNQLIKENNYIENTSENYRYDTYGNLTIKRTVNLNDGYLINEDKYEYNNNDWTDQLSKFNNDTILYDQIGNPISIGNKTLSWINGRELSSYSDENNHVYYKYNNDGIRTSKTVNNVKTEYYLEGNNIIFEKTGNNIIYYLRDEDGDLEGIKYNNNIYYYIKNIQNDVIGILDNDCNAIAWYEYDSWGNIKSIKDNNNNNIINSNHIAHINPYRYRSYYYDKETNLYYLNNRYYSPLWRRFINADSYISTGQGFQGYNMFVYAGNNPINNFDSTGKFFNKIWKKIKKTVTKVAKKVKKVVKKIAQDFVYQIKDSFNTIKNTFVSEIGRGTGVGFSSKGKLKTGGEARKTKVTRKTNKKTTTYIAEEASMTILGFGISKSKQYDCSTKNICELGTLFNEKELSTYEVKQTDAFETPIGNIDTEGNVFIGIEFGISLFGEFHIKIGWELHDFNRGYDENED